VIGPIAVVPSYPASAVLATIPNPVNESRAGGLSILPIRAKGRGGNLGPMIATGTSHIAEGSKTVAVPIPEIVTVKLVNGTAKNPLLEAMLAVSPIPIRFTVAFVNVVVPIWPEATPVISYVITEA
jgi:hypothetical protein